MASEFPQIPTYPDWGALLRANDIPNPRFSTAIRRNEGSVNNLQLTASPKHNHNHHRRPTRSRRRYTSIMSQSPGSGVGGSPARTAGSPAASSSTTSRKRKADTQHGSRSGKGGDTTSTLACNQCRLKKVKVGGGAEAMGR